MRVRMVFTAVLAALGVLALAGAAGATRASEGSHGGRPLHATLLPENQVPPTDSSTAPVSRS